MLKEIYTYKQFKELCTKNNFKCFFIIRCLFFYFYLVKQRKFQSLFYNFLDIKQIQTMSQLIQQKKYQSLQTKHKQSTIDNLEIDTIQKRHKTLLKRTNNNRTRSNSKGSNSIHQDQIKSISKFYVKNFFQKASNIKQSYTNIKNAKNLQNQNFEFKDKMNQARLPQMRLLNCQFSNSSSNLVSSQILKQSINELTNDSINTNDKQLLITIKQLKQQLLYSQIAREDLLNQNHQLKQQITKMEGLSYYQNQKKTIQQLRLENSQLLKQINLLKQIEIENNPSYQLKKALIQIQKMQQQVKQTKKQLCSAVNALQLLKKIYQAQEQEKIAKNMKIQEINNKYKELKNRFQQLKDQKQQSQQQTKIDICPEIVPEKVKKVIKIRR